MHVLIYPCVCGSKFLPTMILLTCASRHGNRYWGCFAI